MAGHKLGTYTVTSRKNEKSRAHFLITSIDKTIETVSRRPIQEKPLCTMIKQTSMYT
jgi:hypothetical protein